MSAGEMAATIAVLELPPKFSRKSQVSTESRNGIKSVPFFFFDLELAWKIFWNSGNVKHATNATTVNGTLISIFHIEIWKVDLLGVFNFHILVKRVKICANHFLFKNFSVENHNLVLRLFTSHYAYKLQLQCCLLPLYKFLHTFFFLSSNLEKNYFKNWNLLTDSARAEITFPKVVKLLLILAPSLSRVPLAPVDSARSDPAKSTREILLT